MAPVLTLLLLAVSPAAAQLRKITPVPPPKPKVIWTACQDAPLIGRFSGMIKCDDGRTKHLETLVYQRPGDDDQRLMADFSLTRSAAVRAGVFVTGAITEGEDGLQLKAGMESPTTRDIVPVQGSLKRLPAPDGVAIYDARLGPITARFEADEKKAKLFLVLPGEKDKVSCEGELKKTQKFQLACSQ